MSSRYGKFHCPACNRTKATKCGADGTFALLRKWDLNSPKADTRVCQSCDKAMTESGDKYVTVYVTSLKYLAAKYPKP